MFYAYPKLYLNQKIIAENYTDSRFEFVKIRVNLCDSQLKQTISYTIVDKYVMLYICHNLVILNPIMNSPLKKSF